MIHQRKLIRDEVERRLKEAATAAGVRIYTNRATPLQDDRTLYPCILLYTLQDSTELRTEEPREYRRDMALAIELIAGQPDDDTDDTLDALAVEVEAVMAGAMADYLQAPSGDCLVADLQLGDSKLGLTEQGALYFSSLRIEYTATYLQHMPGEDSQALDELDTVAIDYNLEGAQALEDQAKDTLTRLFSAEVAALLLEQGGILYLEEQGGLLLEGN